MSTPNPYKAGLAALAVMASSSVIFFVLGCAQGTAPAIPVEAARIDPPARFALWWRLTEACSGVTGKLTDVEWYVLPNASTIDIDGERLHGYWIGSPDRIVLADAHRLDGPLVRHEMLHALLHSALHPRTAFLSACDGIVSCDGGCASETGGRTPPAETATELLPRDVQTRVEIVPSAPAASLDSGALAVIITIANPRSEPVWVRLSPQGPGDPFSHTFGVLVDYDDPSRIASSSYEWISPTRFPLGTGESRHYVWDGELPAGRFGIRGYFNVDTAPRSVIQVEP